MTSGETKIRLNFYGKNKTATVTCFKNVVGEYCNSFLSQAKHGVYYYLTKLNSAFADSAKDILLESPAAEGSNINTTTDIIVQKKNTEDDNVPEKKENERPDTKWDLCIKNDFIQTIESNLTYHERQFCFPGINLPFPYRYFPWQISVKETIVYDDNLTETWINILKQKGNIAGDYSNNATVVLELTPTVRLIRSDRSRTTALFKVITTIDCKNVDLQTGTYSGVGTFAVRGTPKVPYVSKAPVGAYHQPDIPGLCEESYNAALKQFIQKLNCLFPVTGSVSGMVTFGNKTTFQFMRGTIDGVESFDDILIYAVENKRISPTIAIAKAEVALNQSTLTVTEWNTSDPEVKNNLMPRIFSGDSTLRLYAVCRKNVK